MSRDPKDPNRSGSRGGPGGPSRGSDNEALEAKRKLEALFGGSGKTGASPAGQSSAQHPPTPSAAPRQIFSSPRKSLNRTPSEYRMRLERLRMAREVADIEQAANTFLQHHQLPDDPDILYKLLEHPDEKIVREALGQISSLLIQDRLTGTLMLEDRLRTLNGNVKEDATLSYISGIQSQIDKKKGG